MPPTVSSLAQFEAACPNADEADEEKEKQSEPSAAGAVRWRLS